MEEEKKEHDIKMKKMEHEMEQVFEQKVKERIEKYKQSEQDVRLLSFLSIPFICYLLSNSHAFFSP